MLAEWQTAPFSSRKQTFTFPGEECSTTTLIFPTLTSAPMQRCPSKRSRSKADVDGEGSENAQNKKRRLRLDLVTSPLSNPFATPTTHIVGRGAPKVLMKRQPQVVGLNGLRKAAIMNSIRGKDQSSRRLKSKQPFNSLQWHTTNQVCGIEFEGKADPPHPPEPDISEKREVQRIPSLGLSNYDALDEEEDDPYEDDCQDETEYGPMYRIVDPTDSVSDNYDLPIDHKNISSTEYSQKPPLEDEMRYVIEENKQPGLFLA